jgi:hypothetical protein
VRGLPHPVSAPRGGRDDLIEAVAWRTPSSAPTTDFLAPTASATAWSSPLRPRLVLLAPAATPPSPAHRRPIRQASNVAGSLLMALGACQGRPGCERLEAVGQAVSGENVAPRRSAPSRFAPRRSAASRSAPSRSALRRSASPRSAAGRQVSRSQASRRSALRKSAPEAGGRQAGRVQVAAAGMFPHGRGPRRRNGRVPGGYRHQRLPAAQRRPAPLARGERHRR